eukprot:763899-Hanusia_phi.AAC.7
MLGQELPVSQTYLTLISSPAFLVSPSFYRLRLLLRSSLSHGDLTRGRQRLMGLWGLRASNTELHGLLVRHRPRRFTDRVNPVTGGAPAGPRPGAGPGLLPGGPAARHASDDRAWPAPRRRRGEGFR